ncbi:MAG: hypothetical protein M3R43_11080, partial [Acidobacteriota bacterium]|nr:hypothetical protein [Acidobacteriota bacterium]
VGWGGAGCGEETGAGKSGCEEDCGESREKESREKESNEEICEEVSARANGRKVPQGLKPAFVWCLLSRLKP